MHPKRPSNPTAYEHSTTPADKWTSRERAKKFAEYAHDNWDEWLHIIVFAINDSESATTGFTPFFLALGYHPRMVPNHDHMTQESSCLIKIINQNLELAKGQIKKQQNIQSTYYNRKRRADEEYSVGCQVMLQSDGICWEINKQRPATALPSFLGPYRVMKIENMHEGTNLTLELPESMSRIHPTFSATYCRIYHPEKKYFPDRAEKHKKPDPEIVVNN
jgi:hypothetical protein